MSNISFQQVPQSLLDSTATKLDALFEEWKPYLVNVSDDELEGMVKMKDRSLPFAQKAKDYVQTNKEFAPAFLDTEAFVVDMNNISGVTPVQKTVQQLATALNRLLLVSNSEAYDAALLYYNSVKLAAGNGQEKAKQIAADLGQRFPSRKAKAAAPKAG